MTENKKHIILNGEDFHKYATDSGIFISTRNSEIDKDELIKQVIQNQTESMKLDVEIEATENILREGDPFTLTRKDYLDNLKGIKGSLYATKIEGGKADE